mgnify:CR=1 FL=1
MYAWSEYEPLLYKNCEMWQLGVSISLMVFLLDGNVSNDAHVRVMNPIFKKNIFKFEATVDLNKCLERVKSSVSLYTCAPLIPSNIGTMTCPN